MISRTKNTGQQRENNEFSRTFPEHTHDILLHIPKHFCKSIAQRCLNEGLFETLYIVPINPSTRFSNFQHCIVKFRKNCDKLLCREEVTTPIFK